MDDTTTTFVGRVATAVDSVTLPGGAFKATFRLASSQRRFDRPSGEWRDGRTLFMTVVVWRKLAEHVALSLRVGDAVMAHGRIFSREYEKDGRTQTVIELEASALGPDLTWCTATLSRKARAGAATATGPNAAESESGGSSIAGADVTGSGWDEVEADGMSEAGTSGAATSEAGVQMRRHEAAVGV